MAKEKELSDLFLDTLKDIYFAEKKILGPPIVVKRHRLLIQPGLISIHQIEVIRDAGQALRLREAASPTTK